MLGVHDLRAKMAEKGVAFARECRIYEVCNPHQAKKILEANLEISTGSRAASRPTRTAANRSSRPSAQAAG